MGSGRDANLIVLHAMSRFLMAMFGRHGASSSERVPPAEGSRNSERLLRRGRVAMSAERDGRALFSTKIAMSIPSPWVPRLFCKGGLAVARRLIPG